MSGPLSTGWRRSGWRRFNPTEILPISRDAGAPTPEAREYGLPRLRQGNTASREMGKISVGTATRAALLASLFLCTAVYGVMFEWINAETGTEDGVTIFLAPPALATIVFALIGAAWAFPSICSTRGVLIAVSLLFFLLLIALRLTDSLNRIWGTASFVDRPPRLGLSIILAQRNWAVPRRVAFSFDSDECSCDLMPADPAPTCWERKAVGNNLFRCDLGAAEWALMRATGLKERDTLVTEQLFVLPRRTFHPPHWLEELAQFCNFLAAPSPSWNSSRVVLVQPKP